MQLGEMKHVMLMFVSTVIGVNSLPATAGDIMTMLAAMQLEALKAD